MVACSTEFHIQPFANQLSSNLVNHVLVNHGLVNTVRTFQSGGGQLRFFSQFGFAILAILCTAALFLFPAVRGSYTAVHGPVTALRSLKNKLLIWLQTGQAALYLRAGRLTRHGCCSWFPLHQVQRLRSSPSEFNSVLRC